MDNQVGVIDRVIKNTIQIMEESKYQIYEILDSSRNEAIAMGMDLQTVMNQTAEICDKVDELERNYCLARLRLTDVSRDFVRYPEVDIKQAYEKAMHLQHELMLYQEKEGYLKARRDDIQKRLRVMECSIERAETIGSQMSVALEYLSGDLGQVTLKIILAQEEERKRIAREIHDGPAQSLANLVVRTEIVERMLHKQEFEMAQNEIVDLQSQVRFSLEEIRKVILHLRPMTLDDLGLVPTLRKFIHDYEDKYRIKTSFEVRGHERRLRSAMEVAIYRLVQEAFTNAAKHAQPSFVACELIYDQEEVRLIVHDNGFGFKVESLEEKLKEHVHFGLLGMQERGGTA